MKTLSLRLLRTILFLVAFGGLTRADNPVLDWNQIGITAALAADQTTSPGSAAQGSIGIYLAYVHLAVFNAVNAIDHRYHSYGVELISKPGASKAAAAISAAYQILAALLPSQASSLQAQYAAALAGIPDNPWKDRGVRIGQVAA